MVLLLAQLLFPLSVVTTLPPAVQGLWRTDAADYAHRRFEMRAHSLTFQVGDSRSEISRYGISRVRQSLTPTGTRFRVEYFDYDDEATRTPLTFEFIYRAASSEIVFTHQSGIVWRREPPTPRE